MSKMKIEPDTLYRIGLPLENLGTVLAYWSSFEPYTKLGIGPAKTPYWVCVYTRDPLVASAIIESIPQSRLAPSSNSHKFSI